MKILRVGLAQINATVGDLEGNVRKIVDAIVGLGHSLGLVTVAEGIEDIASADRLSALGCQLGQGFWFGHPSPVAEQNEEAERAVA